MNQHDRKEVLRAIRDAEARELAVTRLRRPDEEISYPGAGVLLVQLVKAPSFEQTVAWELRELMGTVSLFRSASPDADERRLLGHDRLQVDPQVLSAWVVSLRALSLAVFPTMPAMGVLDGTRLEACFGVGFGTRFRATWIHEHAPAEWSPLERLVTSMMEQFETLPINAEGSGSP